MKKSRLSLLLLLYVLAVSIQQIHAQSASNWNLTGKVVSSKQEPLAGVTVTLKGTSTVTTTQADGTFTLPIKTTSGILVFSMVGFNTQEIPFSNADPVNTSLVEQTKDLNDVVVVGYTTQRKKDIIGAVTVVNTKDLLSTPAGNVTTALQGRAPGVTVGGDGTPGGVAKVRVRGFGSFGGSDPLYIIDGVPSTSGINNLNQNDIESLQVLKDAAAASVYGSRAANGVVIITTKKGKTGANRITLDAYTGYSFVSKSQFPEMLNAQQYGELYWQQMRGAGLTSSSPSWGNPQYGNGETPVIPEYVYVNNNGVSYGGAQLEGLKTTNPSLFASLTDPANYNFKTHQIVKSANTNWFDEVFDKAPQNNIQLNVSGASDKGNYSMSLNYFDQVSPANKQSYYKRYSLRANSSYKIAKFITAGENLQIAFANSNLFSTALNNGTNVTSAYLASPLLPVYDIAGNPAGSAAPGLGGAVVDGGGTNPVTEPYKHRFDRTLTYPIFGNAYVDVNILPELTFHSSFGIDYVSNSSRYFTPTSVEYAQNTTTNSLSVGNNNSNTWTWTNTLNYSKQLGANHNIKALLGYEAIKTYAEINTANRLNYAVENNPDFMVLNAGTGTQTNTGTYNRSALVSQFARLDYTFKEKYLLGLTVRRDQSSKFAQNTRTGYFPAVALGWRMSEEGFLRNSSWINDLKLRASWGIIGNQNGLSNENQYNVYLQDLNNGYPVSGANSSYTNSFILSRLGNSNAKWERNTTTNIGVDGTFFNNKLDVSIEVYNKETKDLLAPQQLPLTGVSIATANLPYLNSGNIRNRGIDVGLTTRGEIIKGLRYTASLTFSQFTNTVLKVLDNPNATIASGSTRIGNVNITKVGSALGSFYGYQTDGFFNSQAEVDAYKTKVSSTWLPPAVGRWKIKDLNGDGLINAQDKTILGSPIPKFQMGGNLALSYKNFDLSAFLFWSYGAKIYNQARWFTDFNNYTFNRSERMLTQSWTPELGNNALLPKLDLTDTYSSSNVTNYFVEDASYLRLKTLQVGYSLPDALAKKMRLQKFRVYLQGQNLFTVTKYTGMDPDANFYGGGTGEGNASDLTMGIQFGSLPASKQVLFGINVIF